MRGVRGVCVTDRLGVAGAAAGVLRYDDLGGRPRRFGVYPSGVTYNAGVDGVAIDADVVGAVGTGGGGGRTDSAKERSGSNAPPCFCLRAIQCAYSVSSTGRATAG